MPWRLTGHVADRQSHRGRSVPIVPRHGLWPVRQGLQETGFHRRPRSGNGGRRCVRCSPRHFRVGVDGSLPGGRLTFFWLCRKKVSKEFLCVWLTGCVFLRWQAGFRPGSRVTFFLPRQKKVTKKKASHVRAAYAVPCATRSVRDTCKLASLKQCKCLESERCSVAQHGLMAGGYLSARPLRELRPNGWFASLTSRGLGCLIPLPSLLTRARHAVPLHLTPETSFLRPHSSLLTPHPSPLTPHPSPLTPHSSLLTPHPSKLKSSGKYPGHF